MAGRQGPKRENLQEAALWLTGDPRVTVSRGPAGPGGAAVGLGARLPGPLARLHSGSGEGGPRVMTSMSDSHVNWRREEMQGGRGGRALAGGHSCLHPAGVGQQGSWPLLSLRTADWARPDAPGLSRCPRPALPPGSQPVGRAQLSKVPGAQRAARRQAHCPEGVSQLDPTRDAAHWGAEPGWGAGQKAPRRPSEKRAFRARRQSGSSR